MRIIWDLALSENLSVGVFLDDNTNEDLKLVGVDILLLMQMKTSGKEVSYFNYFIIYSSNYIFIFIL